MDEEKKVKIYVELEGVGKLSSESFKLDWSSRDVTLRISGLNRAGYIFKASPLYAEIKNATMKTKSNRVILVLEKSAAEPW